MEKLFGWNAANPSAFASLVAAVIAASVALIVFAITQLLTGRRERTRFFIPKLEELYLLLNSVAEDNVRFFKMSYLVISGDAPESERMAALDELDLYGHKTAKQIIMYIRLYFPSLSPIHQLLFAAQRDLNNLMFRLHTDDPPTVPEIEKASGRIAHLLRLMEQEIITNRDHLVQDYFFRKRYQKTPHKEINAEPSAPPSGPVMNMGS